MGRWGITGTIIMGMYYGKVCNPSCYHFQKCDYCMSKGWGSQTCGDKLFCSQKFRCKYAHYSVNTVSTNVCQNMGI